MGTEMKLGSEKFRMAAEEAATHYLYELIELCMAAGDSGVEARVDLAKVLRGSATVGESRHLRGRSTRRPVFPSGAEAPVLQLTVLKYTNINSARREWSRLFGRQLTDREIVEDLTERLDHAQLTGEAYFAMPLLLAQELLLLAKAGIKRSRGRQRLAPDQKLSLETVISCARACKQRLLDEACKEGRKLKALDAELQAVEQARHYSYYEPFSAEPVSVQLSSAEYVRRQMHMRRAV
jgi:hypothetical protein